MHEVDQHILDATKQLDCSFDEEHTSIGSWKTENIMEFLIRALWRIDPFTKDSLPSCKIPPSINAKFSTAHKVAEKLNDMRVSPGLKLTEQSLLYGEISEYRKLFLDVIRLFPNLKDAGGEGEEDDDLLERARKHHEDREWAPFYCRNLHMRHKGLYWYPSANQPELYPFNRKPDTGRRKDPRGFVVSVLTQVGKQTAKPSLLPKPKIAPKPVISQEESTVEEDPRAKEISQLKEQLQNAQEQYDITENEMARLEWEMNRPKTPIVPISDEMIAALEDSETRDKLLHFLEQSDGKFNRLEEQWEAARHEKLTELQEARNLYGGTSRLNALKLRKEDYLQYERDAEEQKEQADRLLIKLGQKAAKIANEPQENRDKITKRLFEMMASLQKQQDELNKVLAENATIQKEMNWTSQTLYRTFSIIEDALYKIHESYKGGQMYRTFGRINVTCTESMNLIEKNGGILRAAERLTDQLEVEKQKNFSVRLERMMADLELIRQENAEFEKQLKH